MTSEGTKRCPKCGETKGHSEFSGDRTRRDGLQTACKPCRASAKRAWCRANPERQRASNRAWNAANPERKRALRRAWEATNRRAVRLRKYGLTPPQWAALFTAQGERCAITLVPEPGSKSGWATDHCHAGGFTRGILTPAANTALGALKDCPEHFASALIYLKVHGKALSSANLADFLDAYARA